MNKTSKLFLGIIVSILIMSCNDKQQGAKTENPRYSAEVEARISRITSSLQVPTSINDEYRLDSLHKRMNYFHTPGVSVAVINDGKIEWARGFGLKNLNSTDSIDINTLFEAGSVSKPVF